MGYVIGIDVGGTFTDAVAANQEGDVVGVKTASTPANYADGALNAIDGLAEALGIDRADLLTDTEYIVHGTTASINALVTGNVEPVGLLTTRGHADSLAIMNIEGRYLGQSAEAAQDVMNTAKPAPAVEPRFIREVTERMDWSGEVVVALDEDGARAAIAELLGMGIQSIAISLLWSFQNPAHERRLRELIHEADPAAFVSLSCEVSPRIREFSRTATTVMNAMVGPTLRRYLGPLSADLVERKLHGPLLIMQGSGGTISADEAPDVAISTVGSVLSGGVVGAAKLAERLGHPNVITADIGGTTFLVGMIVDGEPIRSATTIVNQHPVNVPAIKVTAIGSGGGAIAWVDAGGNLRLGPQSAAADPGPAAYGMGGTSPTVTDADIVLGIIDPDYFVGGTRRLSRELAEQAILDNIGRPLGLDALQAAAAIYEIQNAQTADLARKVVVEQGHDPRDFVMYAFGGAGPIHAPAIASQLGARELVVPLGAAASGFSAYGLSTSDLVFTAELSDPCPFPIPADQVADRFGQLEARVLERLESQNVEVQSIELIREFDARYASQMFEVTAPAPSGPLDEAAVAAMEEAFHARYAQMYGEGAGFKPAGTHLITYRVRGVGRLVGRPGLPSVPAAGGPSAADAIKGQRSVYLDMSRGFEPTDIYDYRRLLAGHVITGPAIVEVATTTVTVPHGVDAVVDELGNLHLGLD